MSFNANRILGKDPNYLMEPKEPMNPVEKIKADLDRAGLVVLKYQDALDLAGQIIATIIINRNCGVLVIKDSEGLESGEGERRLTAIVEGWQERLKELEGLVS